MSERCARNAGGARDRAGTNVRGFVGLGLAGFVLVGLVGITGLAGLCPGFALGVVGLPGGMFASLLLLLLTVGALKAGESA